MIEFDDILVTTENHSINENKLDVIIIVGQSGADEPYVPKYRQACIDHHLNYKIVGSGNKNDPVTLRDLDELPRASVVILTGHGGVSPLDHQHQFDINHTKSNLSADLIELIQKQTQADKFLISTCHGGAIASDLSKNNFYKNLTPYTQILITATAKETSLAYNSKELILNLINKIAENKKQENKYFFAQCVHDGLITTPESLTYLITSDDKLHKKTLHLKKKYLDKIQQKKITDTATIERYQAYLIKKFNGVVNGLNLPPYEEMVLDTDEKNIIQNIIRKGNNESKILHYKTTLMGYHVDQVPHDNKHQAILDEILRQLSSEEFKWLMQEIDATGFSTLFWLACSVKGRELLARIDPTLIHEKPLNKIISNGPDKGESALFWLSWSAKGQEILARINPKLIHEEALNTLNSDGPTKDKSVLFLLACREKGRELLARIDPKLIHEEALNKIITDDSYKGESALFWLASSVKGREILARIDPKLIHEKALNTVIQKGSYRNYSALYCLLVSANGRNLILKNKQWLALFSKKALNTVIEVPGSDQGKSAAYWLLHTEVGKQILECDPNLKSKVIAETVTNNNNKRKLFFEDNKSIKKIDSYTHSTIKVIPKSPYTNSTKQTFFPEHKEKGQASLKYSNLMLN